MKNNKNLGFTLVELIVVITILAVLATVGFISFSNHLSGTRDTNRLTQLSKIHSGLEVYSTKNKLPLPEDKVEVWASGTLIGYQGYMGKNTLAMIEYEKGGIDPRDEQYFTYYVTADKIHFQLMTYLEDENNLDTAQNINGNFLIPKANALNYTKRFPAVYGEKLGILTESITNLPIQEVDTIISSGYLDIVTTTGSYTANFTNEDSVTGTGLVLDIVANPEKSCYSILMTGRGETDGIYEINPTGNSPIKAYCDMTTDGGGWTMLIGDNTTSTYTVDHDIYWKKNYNGPELINNQNRRNIKGVSNSYYMMNVSSIMFYTEDGGYSIYNLNDSYKNMTIVDLVNKVSSINGVTQLNVRTIVQNSVEIGNLIKKNKGTNGYNCGLTWGAGNKLYSLGGAGYAGAHSAIFHIHPTYLNYPRASQFGGGTTSLGWNQYDGGIPAGNPTCISENANKHRDNNTYFFLMGR